MQNTVRPSLRLVVSGNTRRVAPHMLSTRDMMERVLMFAVVSLMWALVILAALQAAR